MLRHKLLLSVIAAVAWIGSTGCRGEAARLPSAAQTQVAPAAATAFRDARQIPRNASHARLGRDTQHESFSAIYNNPEEGISFHYPRNYSLEEGDIQEHSFFLQRQEDLDTDQPGATLLATVLIPEDGYPNTTFTHGSVQLAVKQAETESSCLAMSEVEQRRNGPRALEAQGLTLHWSGQENEVAGTKILERNYAGYAQRTCYQFRLIVAAEDLAADPDGFTKNADLSRIMKHLERVVKSARTFVKSVPAEISEE